MKIIPAIFEEHEIRRLYDEKTETWFLSVVDIVQILTQQPDYKAARNYWKVLKNRLAKEGSQSVTNCYRQRTSGPLLDRIDIYCEVPLVDFRELSPNAASGDKSETIRERVVQARLIQTERFHEAGNSTNAAMRPRQMKMHCQIDSEATGYPEHAMEEMNFSARAHDRILKVARTLADLAGSPNIHATDVLEAIQYRSLDRMLIS